MNLRFLLMLLMLNLGSNRGFKTINEISHQEGGKTHSQTILRIKQEIGKDRFGTWMQSVQHHELVTNFKPAIENTKMLLNRRLLSSRFKRHIESIETSVPTQSNGNSSRSQKHFCILKQSEKSVIYECKPSLLWNDELIWDLCKSSQNGTEGKTLHTRISKLAYNKTCLVLEFHYDVVIVSDVLRRWKVPINVTVLRLQFQNIGTLKRTPFNELTKTLTTLRLDSNLISYISQSVFAGLQELAELDLSHNRLSLEGLPRGVFDNLRNLKRLNLAFNRLKFIEESTFSCLASLSYLDLSNNILADIDKNAFSQLRNSPSMVINLQQNRLTHPRKEWLLFPRRFSYSATCSPQDQASQHTRFLDNSKSIKMRIIWGSENSWQCSCNSSFAILEFLKTTILHQNLLSEKNKKNCRKAATSTPADQNFFQVQWDVDFPCSDLNAEASPIGPGYPLLSAEAIYNSCCTVNNTQDASNLLSQDCEFLFDWIDKNVPKNDSNDEQHGLTDNQVTIIGIIIVVLSPILLTLCPDCKKKVVVKQKDNSNEVARETNNRVSSSLISKSVARTT